jgi:transcriptional regulator with XRE-family HTH domain
MKDDAPDPFMLKARELFKASGKTLDELGVAMGYEGEVARKSAWQFLNKVGDPRLSSVRRFAAALGVPLSELVTEK